MNDGKKVLISVIIPVYNTEMYVEQTIKSILCQTIGFENIELILVNNASTDHSGIICKKYAQMHPNNIIYIELKENHGPCGARNAGLDIASGKYINYLDSDDIWESDALEQLTNFMILHKNECDLVAGRLRHFDGREAWHVLDWKYEKKDSIIVNILEKPEYIQLHLGSIIIKAKIAKQYKHDINMRHAEDAKYVNQIILNRGSYGLCRNAVYLYRKRRSEDSVLQNVGTSISWYHDTPKGVYKFLIDESIAKYGRVLEYVQFLIMYELQWRLSKKYIDEKADSERYIKQISSLLQYIDDEILLKQKNLWVERKIFALRLKYHSLPEFVYSLYPKDSALHLRTVLLYNNKIHIRGFVRFPYDYNYDGICILINNRQEMDIDFEPYNICDDVFSLGINVAHARTFFHIIPYSFNMIIRFYLKENGKKIQENIKLFRDSQVSDECTIGENYIEIKQK